MNGKRVLITGASIAGPTTAWWLHKYGYECTIVERFSEPRKGGQNVDIRGVGREVIDRMGLLPLVLEHNSTELGVQFLKRDGSVAGSFPAEPEGMSTDLEILRGDLSEILYDATKGFTTYIFGDCIREIENLEDGRGVRVIFDSGKKEVYDWVIIAEGARSLTRKLVFGDEPEFKPVGQCLSLPRLPNETRWAQWYNATSRRLLLLRPDNHNRTQAMICYCTPTSKGYEHKSISEQKSFIKDLFKDAGWQAPRVISELDDSNDFWFDYIGQIHAPRWVDGRIALVGDAGYCPTPISGMGTTLGLAGAYVLAGEIYLADRDADQGEASDDGEEKDSGKGRKMEVDLSGYERNLRKFVDIGQTLMPGAPNIVNPETWWGLDFFAGVMGILAWMNSIKTIKAFGEYFMTPKSKQYILPEYHTKGQ